MGVKSNVNRALVFLLYDPAGLVDDSVLDTLAGFRPHVEKLMVVVNGSLQPESLDKLSPLVDRVLERANVGFDVGAYRDALSLIGWEELKGFDELLLVNYTFFGPVGSFGPLLERMSDREVDFWGVTDHPAVTPHPYVGRGTMPHHLQSYWLGIRGRLLSSPLFRDYWLSLADPTSYSEVVTNFECEFTRHFGDLGFTWEAAFPSENYGVANTTMEAPLALLHDGCPLFKKRLYFHDVPALVDQGISTAAVTAEAGRLGYDENLIVEGVGRRATTRELTLGLGASYVRTGRAPSDVGEGERHPRIATTESRPWKTLASEGTESLLGEAEILLVAPRATKPHLRADGIRLRYHNARRAIMGDPQFILDLFDQHHLLGALYPYVQVIGTTVKGRAWYAKSVAGLKFATSLGLRGPFSQTSPVAPYRGAAAYRRSVLELIEKTIREAGGWDHLVQQVGDEDELENLLDLLSADIAREGGYFVGETGDIREAAAGMVLVTELLSHAPRVYRDYTSYPYSGRVISPSIKNRIGKAIQNASPTAFDRLHDVELQLRGALSNLKKGGK